MTEFSDSLQLPFARRPTRSTEASEACSDRGDACTGTPVPSDHVSRPSFDNMQGTLMYLLVEPPKDYTDAKNGVRFVPLYVCPAIDLRATRPLYVMAIAV